MYSVLETDCFKKSVKKLLDEENLSNLKNFLSVNPTAGVVIKNSSDLRKLRWNLNNNKGKSGGCRVIYYFKNDKGEIILLLGYAKNVQTDLTQKQIKILANIINEYYK